MDDFNYQEGIKIPEENQVNQQKEVFKQWFPFSRMGVFYFCILIGTNLIAVIVVAALSFHATITATIQNGGMVDYAAAMQTVSEKVVNNMAVIMLIAYAITIPLCMLIAKTVPKYPNTQKEKWGIGKLSIFLVVSIGLMMFGNFVSQIGQTIVAIVTGHQMTNPLDSILNDNNIMGSIFMVVIIAPIIEEFLFRKVLIDRVSVYGDKIAILLSGILFGLFHGNLFQVVYAMLLGMLLAYVYLKTSRIEYCIGLHMIINILGGALPLLLSQGLDTDVINNMQIDKIMNMAPQLAGMGAIVIIEIGCMIATIAILIVFRKQIIFAPGAIEIAKGKQFKTIFLNVGMILFFAVSVLIFLTNAMA